MPYWRELHFDSEMGNYNLALQCIIYTSRVAVCIPIKIEIQNRTEQNRTEQNRTEQNRTEQNRTERTRTDQNRTETEQNRTEHTFI